MLFKLLERIVDPLILIIQIIAKYMILLIIKLAIIWSNFMDFMIYFKHNI